MIHWKRQSINQIRLKNNSQYSTGVKVEANLKKLKMQLNTGTYLQYKHKKSVSKSALFCILLAEHTYQTPQRWFPWTINLEVKITRECFKDDNASQWKSGKFDPGSLRNP